MKYCPRPAACRASPEASCALPAAGHPDEVASTMLAQLLEQRGMTSRVVPHAACARGTIALLNVSDTTMVCVSYVAATGNPSHLRYLMRRLRRRLPRGVPILVGFWPEEEEILHDERLRAAVGADFYTSSLREAVETCMTAPHAATEASQPSITTVAA